MRTNVVSLTATALYEQMLSVKDASNKDLEHESNKMESMALGAQQIANLAEQEVKLIIGTNVIPQDSMLISGIKDIVVKPPKSRGLLSDDFTRGVVKD